MIPLQAIDVGGALPSPEMVAVALLFFLAGMTVPTRYGIERLEGFGRIMAAKLPYKAPPGQDAETAMQEAVGNDPEEDGEGSDA
ncbi:hypothetical protein [Halorientalis halophila]|uniref:hypothetical protein n=1 Tax=Halorientalis halophila TaxID=3108499 RepID=UPI0030084AAB